MRAKLETRKLFRLIDANFNRAKEGLRVCEDVCRFIEDDAALTRQYKNARHELTTIVASLGIADVIAARNIAGDVGRTSIPREMKRRDCRDVLYANSQRVKESVRVLEEISKLIRPATALKLKQLRYRIYAVEKAMVGQS